MAFFGVDRYSNEKCDYFYMDVIRFCSGVYVSSVSVFIENIPAVVPSPSVPRARV